MKKIKQFVVSLLIICMVIASVPSTKVNAATITRSEVSQKLGNLMNQYVGQKGNWNYATGSQCYGFAHLIFDNIFNRGEKIVGNGAVSSNSTNYKLNNVASDIKTIGTLAPGYTMDQLKNLLNQAAPGDYIQVRRRSSGGPHSMICVSVSANNSIEIFDANSNGDGYVRHYTQSYSEFMNKNSGVSVYRYSDYNAAEAVHNCADHEGQERWRVTVSSVLNIRSGAGVNYSKTGTLSNGTEIYITEKADNDGYTWGKLSTGQGWVALSGNATYLCGSIKPNYNIKIRCWFSKSPMGDSGKDVNTLDDLYLCYRIFDDNSGKNYDEIEQANYTVKETILKPDGSEAFSYSYNNDNNWIKITPDSGGKYKGKIEVSGDKSGCYNLEINVIARQDVIGIYISSDAGGSNKIDSIELGGNIYAHYKLYDKNTGDTLNQYRDLNYSVRQVICDPQGKIVKESVSNNIDNAYINIVPSSAGNYTYKAIFTVNNNSITSSTTINVKNIYTIKYNANGGSGEPVSQTKIEGSTMKLSSTKPSKSFSVTFNADGGSVNVTQKKLYSEFDSWNTSINGTGIRYTAGQEYNKNSNLTLYAQWKNVKIGSLPEPTKKGYIFNGWYDGDKKIDENYIVSSNVTLKAKWVKKLDASVISSLNGIAYIGNTVRFNASATGGSGNYMYKYLIKDDKGEWYKLKDYDKENVFNWTPGVIGNKTIYVDIKDDAGQYKRIAIPYQIKAYELNGKIEMTSNGNTVVGNNVRLTVNATGGTGNYTYKFLITDASGNWYKLKDYSSSNVCQWMPSTSGQKKICVDIKDANGNVCRKELNVYVTPQLSGNLWSDTGDKCFSGSNVTLAAKGVNGSGIYMYKFLISDTAGNWYKLQDYSANNKIVWKANFSGIKYLYIDIKDQTGKIVRLNKTIAVENKSSVENTSIRLTTNGTGNSGVNSPVNIKAEVAGGTGSYKYKFLLSDDNGNWYKLQDYSSSNNCVWVPSNAGKRYLHVDVKDDYGNVKRMTIPYIVSSSGKFTHI